jgi:hypothetical protein
MPRAPVEKVVAVALAAESKFGELGFMHPYA